MQVAIYARYSSDNQRDTSIDDQARNCENYAARKDWVIVNRYEDRAISGTNRSRPGYQAMLRDAQAGRFSAILVDDLSRLSRDDVETKLVIRRLKSWGCGLIGVSDGINIADKGYKLQTGMRGLMNELYIDDLKEKTHRGLTGQVSRGMSAGGLSFGYSSIPGDGGSKLVIAEAQAVIVRMIFEWYAQGWSCQKIAAELNKRRAPSPRGSSWATSAIYGSPTKGTGILNNELYAGRYIWNRSQWIKDPDTGKRIRRDRPPHEWQSQEKPELRIVDHDTWDVVRARMGATRLRGGSSGKGARPSTLFGGLVQCGTCGGAIVATDRHLYGCATRKDRGEAICTGISVPRKKLDKSLLDYVREELSSPASIAEAQRQVAEVAKQEPKTDDPRKRLNELEQEINRMVDAIANIGLSPALQSRLRQAEVELAKLRASKPAKAIKIPNVAEIYRNMLNALEDVLQTDVARARELLRGMLGEMKLVKTAQGVDAVIEAEGVEKMISNSTPLGVVAGAGFCTQRRIPITRHDYT